MVAGTTRSLAVHYAFKQLNRKKTHPVKESEVNNRNANV